jgi:hypothetical protein
MNFSFSPSKIIDRFNFHELPEINQVQFLIAGRNAWGPATFSLLQIFSAGDTGEQMMWEYFKITNTTSGMHLYDAWILADDSGTIFTANAAISVQIEMCQSFIDSVISDEETVAIATAIRNAYMRTKKPFDNETGGFDSLAFARYWDNFYKKKDAALPDESYWAYLTKKLEMKIPV